MNASNPIHSFEQLVKRIHPEAKLIRHWPLTGGVSAQTTAIEIQHADGKFQKMVVRQHGEADLKHNSNVAQHEYQLLRQLHDVGLAVPDAYDSSGDIFSSPHVVIEFIEGGTVFNPVDLDDYLKQCATHLATIHQVDVESLDLGFLSTQTESYAKKIQAQSDLLDESINEGQVREVLSETWPWPQHNPMGLLHGDFWPGNLLWENQKLVGVIDWEDAHLGDPLIDFAISRVEIALAFGLEALALFTHHYQLLMQLDTRNLSYWDLFAVLRYPYKLSEWTEDASTEKRWRQRINKFVDNAVLNLSV